MTTSTKIILIVAVVLVLFLIVSPWLLERYIYQGPPTGPARLPYWIEHYGEDGGVK